MMQFPFLQLVGQNRAELCDEQLPIKSAEGVENRCEEVILRSHICEEVILMSRLRMEEYTVLRTKAHNTQ
jgi:hypothetical protein